MSKNTDFEEELKKTFKDIENKQTQNYSGGGISIMSLCFILFFVFAILKISGAIAWSWVYVCIPLMIAGGIVALIMLLVIFLIILSLAVYLLSKKE